MSNAGDAETSANTRSFQALPRRFSAAIGNVVRETREAWPGLSTYKRFEHLVSLALTAIIALVIVVALLELCFRVVMLLLYGLLDPADQEVFQALFGMILTVLIALEFNHSIVEVLERDNSIVQVRTVVLIALLVLVRKFIVLDVNKTEPLTIIGLAAAVLALGSAHWLMRDQDRPAKKSP
jgi:uncharacterized membrane protein (DUF373 family)